MIIAELGLAHEGCLPMAVAMVDAAAEAGADAIKLQTFGDYNHNYPNLTLLETIAVKDHCNYKKIRFLAAPHDMTAIDFVDTLVDIHKIASPFLTNAKFVQKVASKGKPILLSTGSFKHRNGMATDNEIRKAISNILEMGNTNITLLHCVSHYPAESDNLYRLEELKKFGFPVGISSHTTSIHMPNVPVIEKHFMLEGMNGVDSEVSLTPLEFIEMVKQLAYIHN